MQLCWNTSDNKCGSTWPELDNNMKSSLIFLAHVLGYNAFITNHASVLPATKIASYFFTSMFTYKKMTNHIVSCFTCPSPTPSFHQTENAESAWLLLSLQCWLERVVSSSASSLWTSFCTKNFTLNNKIHKPNINYQNIKKKTDFKCK